MLSSVLSSVLSSKRDTIIDSDTMSPVKQYLETLKEMKRKYGNNNTCVLIEVGSFYEMYGLDESDTIFTVASFLRILVTKKNKNIASISVSNPYMSGFTNSALSKYVNILLENQYTVVRIDQISRATKTSPFRREVGRIYSPSTTLDLIPLNSINTNNKTSLLLLYVEMDRKNKGFGCGIANIDLSRGTVRVSEIYDEEELLSTIGRVDFRELILVGCAVDSLKDLGFYIPKDEEMHRIDYQSVLLDRIYPNEGMLRSIEYLNLEFVAFARIALCYALNYAYEHDKRIIFKLNKPIIENNTNILRLSNFASEQLQVFPPSRRRNRGVVSLECVVNRCQTSMGRRELRQRLLNPLTDVDELNERYEKIEYFLKIRTEEESTIVFNQLKRIKDVEKLHRKLVVGLIQPYELLTLLDSYDAIKEISEQIKKNKKMLWNIDCLGIDCFLKQYNEIIALNEQNVIQYQVSYCKKYEALCLQRDSLMGKMDRIVQLMSSKIEWSSKKKINLHIEYNDKIGHFVKTTKLRASAIKENWKSNDSVQVIVIGSVAKIKTTELSILSNKLIDLEIELNEHCKVLYEKLLYTLQNTIPHTIHPTIADIDISYTSALIAHTNKYCRPTISHSTDESPSFVEATELRHPISEVIHTDTKFVPNDLKGKNDRGIVLTGMNGAGKSVYMKSVALSIIMSQSGLYVPASTYRFTPFTQLMTRIGNGDNLLQGHSTFVCEMIQLREILSKANQSTFVIADELCAGSEAISAKAILASTITSLIERNCCFIASTHIHGLEDIVPKEKVTFAHIEVLLNGNDIIYTRKLKMGCSSTLYGLEVCRYLIDDKDFISRAIEIRKKIVGSDCERIVQTKRSKYNKKVLVDRCEICGTTQANELDVHHIEFQHTADMCGYIGSFHKNIKANLVVLCKKHHNQVHDNTLTIHGWVASAKKKLVLQYSNNN
jgi:DNA mismatch repair protein MutS